MDNMTCTDETQPWTKSKCREGMWSAEEPTTLKDIAGTIRMLEVASDTSGWKVVSVSLGRPATGARPSYPTIIELKSGSRGQYKWRYFIPSNPANRGCGDAKDIIKASPSILKFLGTTAEGL